MKIGHVVPIYRPGILPGCAKYVQDISEALSKKGHSVTVLTANALTGRGWVDPLFGKYASKEEEVMDGVRVKRLPTRWQVTAAAYVVRRLAGRFLPPTVRNHVTLLSAGPYLASLKEELARGDYDVIHVTAFPFVIVRLVRDACRSLKRPFLCAPLIHFEDPLHQNPLLWDVLKEASVVIALSNYEKEGIIRRGVHSSRIRVIPPGVNLEEAKEAKGERFRARYELEGKQIVLFAGTKSHDKGALHLVEAASRLGPYEKDLVLVGLGLSTPEWEKKKRLLPKGRLLDLGFVSEEEKRDAFDACDLFAMPSRYDSFGLVYLEAWRCGKPVIGANVGAIPEVIEDGKDGLLVEFGNVSQLASTMARLLGDPALRREMGQAGKRKVLERLNWDKNIPPLEEVYARVPS